MASILEQNFRDITPRYFEMFNKNYTQSKNNGIIDEEDVPGGYWNIGLAIMPGEMEEFTGEVQYNTPASASRITETKTYVWGGQLPRDLLNRSDALTSGRVSRLMTGLNGKFISHLDKKLAAMKVNGTASNTAVVGTGAFFSTTAAMPGGETFANLVSGAWTDSAAEVVAACHRAQAHFLTLRGVADVLVHDSFPQLGLIYSPSHTGLHQMVMEALYPNEGGRTINTLKAGSIVPMPDPYLASTFDDLIFVNLSSGEKVFQVGYEFRPMLEMNRSSSADSWRTKRMFRCELAVGYEAAYGSPVGALYLQDA